MAQAARIELIAGPEDGRQLEVEGDEDGQPPLQFRVGTTTYERANFPQQNGVWRYRLVR